MTIAKTQAIVLPVIYVMEIALDMEGSRNTFSLHAVVVPLGCTCLRQLFISNLSVRTVPLTVTHQLPPSSSSDMPPYVHQYAHTLTNAHTCLLMHMYKQGHHRHAEARCAELAGELAQTQAAVAEGRAAGVAGQEVEHLKSQLEEVTTQLEDLQAQVCAYCLLISALNCCIVW